MEPIDVTPTTKGAYRQRPASMQMPSTTRKPVKVTTEQAGVVYQWDRPGSGQAM